MLERRRKRKKILWLYGKCLRKEFKDFVTLISLKLNNLAQFLTFNNSSVACEILHVYLALNSVGYAMDE
jgi:hypothetical protein